MHIKESLETDFKIHFGHLVEKTFILVPKVNI